MPSKIIKDQALPPHCLIDDNGEISISGENQHGLFLLDAFTSKWNKTKKYSMHKPKKHFTQEMAKP